MLFKTALTLLGSSRSAPPREPRLDPTPDILFRYGSQEDITNMSLSRDIYLEAFSVCRPYFLDHEAAILVDNLAYDLDREDENFPRDIALPHEVVWIEFDERELCRDRHARGLPVPSSHRDADLRGVLFDNRDPSALCIRSFTRLINGSFLEPYHEVIIRKDESGRPDIARTEAIPVEHMISMMRHGPRISEENARRVIEMDMSPARTAYLLGYALFALLEGRPEDVQTKSEPLFSDKEMRTARKFGKSHITGAPNSHLTISLTDPARRYIQQMREDAEDRKTVEADRQPPGAS